MAIETIGALAGITKTVIDSLKGLRDLVGRSDDEPVSELKVAFSEFQERIGSIATQLEQAEMLGRMLPIWLKELSKFEVWETGPSDETLQMFDRDLRNFISDSVRDHFSSVFFQASFDQLPTVLVLLKDLRQKLNDLDGSLQAIPHSSIEGMKLHLPIVKTRLHDLRIVAVKLDNNANDVRRNLIAELRHAAEVKPDDEPSKN